ncbi:hypothetical protein D3C79_522150 [compost metagenome]
MVTIHAAIPSALPVPSTKVKASSPQASRRSNPANRLSMMAANTIRHWVTISQRRRSTRSAITPPGSANRKTGSVTALCTSDTMIGEAVSVVMIHAAPTVCIQIARFTTAPASHKPRKARLRNGAHAEPSLIIAP